MSLSPLPSHPNSLSSRIPSIAALFHTILFHRTTGKVHPSPSLPPSPILSPLLPSLQFSYTSPNSATFSVGTVGIQDVDLTLAGFTYVCKSYCSPNPLNCVCACVRTCTGPL